MAERGAVSGLDARGEEAIAKLFKSKNILNNSQVFEYLRKSIPDEEILNRTYESYVKRSAKVSRKARQFKIKLLEKYPNLTENKLIKKARQYKEKYELTDAEFDLFTKFLHDDNRDKRADFNPIKNTPIGKVLGYKPEYHQTHLTYDDKDANDLKNIISIYNNSLGLSRRVKIQSLTYTDCGQSAMTGKFDISRHNVFQHINPVIAALFLPKIQALEYRMIFANISELIYNLNEGRPRKDIPTEMLYRDLVSDPTQSSAQSDLVRPMHDLYKRSILQTKLLESIEALRSGQYYNTDVKGFEEILSDYPPSVYDAPDLLYSKDAGNILRRVLNAFSFRPTLVSISRVISNIKQVSVFLNLSDKYKHLDHEDVKQPVRIPMINIRIPPKSSDITIENIIKISPDGMPTQWFNDQSNPVLYNQKIINSNGVIFYYINRQYSSVNEAVNEAVNNEVGGLGGMTTTYTFSKIPPMISGATKLNDRPVEFNSSMVIGNRTYSLRSVVCDEVVRIGETNIISGTSAIISKKVGVEGMGFEPHTHYYYCPQNANRIIENEQITPITLIPTTGMGAPFASTFEGISRTRGVIFMYADVNAEM